MDGPLSFSFSWHRRPQPPSGEVAGAGVFLGQGGKTRPRTRQISRSSRRVIGRPKTQNALYGLLAAPRPPRVESYRPDPRRLVRGLSEPRRSGPHALGPRPTSGPDRRV